MTSISKQTSPITLVLLPLLVLAVNMQTVYAVGEPPPLPTASFQPPEVVVREGQTFQINVTIDVDAYWKMIGFDTDPINPGTPIYWPPAFNDSVLTLVDIDEGPFMKQFSTPPRTSCDYTYFTGSTMAGDWVIAILLVPSDSGWTVFPDGNGTLATLTFRAIAEGTTNFTLRSRCHGVTESGQTFTIDEVILRTQIIVKPRPNGDVNEEGRIDMRDVGEAALAFGSNPSNPRWNSMVDINQDDRIDLKDIAEIARRFGEH